MDKQNIDNIYVDDIDIKDKPMQYQVKAVLSGNILEIYKYDNRQWNHRNRKISKHNASMKDNENDINKIDRQKEYINKSKRDIRRLIEANLHQGKEYDKFLTLTFAKNVTDKEYCLMKYRSFIKSLQRAYKVVKYITVVEKQKRGAFHFHIILFDFPYIDLTSLNQKWQQGFTDIKIIKDNQFTKNGHKYAFSKYIVKYLGKDFGGTTKKRERRYYKSNNLKSSIELFENDVYSLLSKHGYYEDYHCSFENKYVGKVMYSKLLLDKKIVVH